MINPKLTLPTLISDYYLVLQS